MKKKINKAGGSIEHKIVFFTLLHLKFNSNLVIGLNVGHKDKPFDNTFD